MTAPATNGARDDLIGLAVAASEANVARETLFREILLGRLPALQFAERNRPRFVVSRSALRQWAREREAAERRPI